MSIDLGILRARWIGLCHQIRLNGEIQWIRILSAYTAPGRTYHNLTHIADCFEQLDSTPEIADNPIAVEFSIWFHDLVYDTRANDNEQRSADAALEFLKGAPIAEQVADIVLATQHNSNERSHDAHLVCDIDLSILGRDPAQYLEYSKALRQEYQQVADTDYAAARAQVLRGLLNRESLYTLTAFQKHYERQARVNLQAEIERLKRPPDHKIRPATNADSPEITRLVFDALLEYGLQPDPDSTDADLADIQGFYHERNGVFDVLLNAQGAILGTVALLPIDNRRCELRKMYLHKNERGKGHGKRLLEHALKRSREMGFETMILETATPLKEAIALYESYGFRPYKPEHMTDRCDQALIKTIVP